MTINIQKLLISSSQNFLSVEDLLNARAVCKCFRDYIDSTHPIFKFINDIFNKKNVTQKNNVMAKVQTLFKYVQKQKDCKDSVKKRNLAKKIAAYVLDGQDLLKLEKWNYKITSDCLFDTDEFWHLFGFQKWFDHHCLKEAQKISD